ncbi:component of SufBCD complex [uncultured Nonlabens sp.]|uniref:component of SufBCD complex n=1 Tax=uncultured Nonlabens sp. TaxID=859306 RepID=UPI0030DA1E60|tara:strand:- start:13728 stop:14165 length:438 start_codon:yes stop_codon:yes gene_type:complete
MKRLFILSFLVLSVVSCKNDKDSTEETPVVKEMTTEVLPEGQQVYRGEFIFIEDAAVLTTRNKIYAVAIDDKMKELDQVAKALKKTKFDMVNVVIHATVKPNPIKAEIGEGWDEMVTITKIIEVTPATSADVIKTGKTLDIKEVK